MRSRPGPYFEYDPTRPVVPLPVWSPPTDVLRTERELVVRLELAGTPADEVHVRVGASELVVRGRRRDPLGQRLRRVDRMEIAFGDFERIIPLPVPVDTDRGSARLADGFLIILLPLANTWTSHAASFEIHL